MKTFLIRKGKHRSTFAWLPIFGSRFSYAFVFDKSARYDIGEAQGSLNKLVGFSDGTLNHHKNSFRLAWDYSFEGTIRIWSYVYRNGEREVQYLHFIFPGEHLSVNVSITEDGERYRIVINEHIIYYARRGDVKCGYKHMLWPYFGGKVRAPHTIKILLKWRRLSKGWM